MPLSTASKLTLGSPTTPHKMSNIYIVPSVTDVDSDAGTDILSTYRANDLVVECIALISSLGIHWTDEDQATQCWVYIADTLIIDCKIGSLNMHIEIHGSI